MSVLTRSQDPVDALQCLVANMQVWESFSGLHGIGESGEVPANVAVDDGDNRLVRKLSSSFCERRGALFSEN